MLEIHIWISQSLLPEPEKDRPIKGEIRAQLNGRQSFKHPWPGWWLPATALVCQDTNQLTSTDKGRVVLNFSSPNSYRMLWKFSLSCLIEEGGEEKGENTVVGQVFAITRVRCFLERLSGSTVPPSGRLPWSNNQWKVYGSRSFCLPVHYMHHWILSSSLRGKIGIIFILQMRFIQVQWPKQGHTSYMHLESGDRPSLTGSNVCLNTPSFSFYNLLVNQSAGAYSPSTPC